MLETYIRLEIYNIKEFLCRIIKRSGEVVEFDPDKIYQAVLKAAQTVYVLTDDFYVRI